MRGSLAGAPAVVTAVFQGVFFAGWMAVTDVVQDHDRSGRALVSSVVAGAVFALIMWFASRRERRNTREIAGDLTAAQRREVLRAAATGTPPSQAELRPAAAALAQSRLDRYASSRTFCLVVFAIFTVMALIGAVVASPWYLLIAAMFAAIEIWTVRYPNLQRRRISALDPAN